ncbi:MAG: lysostaphin resistance A-like protein [Gemmatimonadota bacterium]
MFDGHSPQATPLALARRALAGGTTGLLGGAALALAAVAALWLGDAYHFAAGDCDAGTLVRRVSRLALWLGGAAALEEILFRGYALTTLQSALGGDGTGRRPVATGPAVLATAVAFALAHGGSPHYGWGAGVALVVMGVVLGLAVVATGTLWSAIGLHAGWNGALAAGAALPVSGVRFPAPCGAGILDGPAGLTGGAFGIEAGAPALLLWGLVGLGLARAVRRRATDYGVGVPPPAANAAAAPAGSPTEAAPGDTPWPSV